MEEVLLQICCRCSNEYSMTHLEVAERKLPGKIDMPLGRE
jgi:hypothetical protein